MRVEQQTDSLIFLQRSILKGQVAPASFQRPYVWREADVEALWDSILMGLPIGAFLLWRPDVAVDSSRLLGPIALSPETHPTLVLDGQNRLATLAWSGTDVEGGVPECASGAELWMGLRHLVADCHARRVRFVDVDEASDPWLVPMHHIGSTLQKELRRIWDGGQADLPKVKWLEDIEHGLRTARIVVTTIHGSAGEARRAFLRISRAGVPMSQEDFDAAVAGSATDAT